MQLFQELIKNSEVDLTKFYQEVHLFYFNPSTYKIGWRFAMLEVGKQILSEGEGKGVLTLLDVESNCCYSCGGSGF